MAKPLLERRFFAVVAQEIGLSASKLHAALQRFARAGLMEAGRLKARSRLVEEFLS